MKIHRLACAIHPLRQAIRKGVVYTHRGLVLHSYALGLADAMGMDERDVIMPIVPMFHANAWGMPFAAVFFGTTQVLPGPGFNPAAYLI